MSEKSFPYNSISGDRKYKAEDFREYFKQFIGNGVFYASSVALKVVQNENMKVTLKSGAAWVNGIGYISDTDIDITLDTADGALNRIDRIVIREDSTTRSTYVAVKKGEYSANPVAKTLQRDADKWELAVADVYVGAGVIQITQANITDQRLNSNVCGIVTGLIEQADITEIFNQFDAYMQEYKTEHTADWTEWTNTREAAMESWESGQKSDFLAWVATIHDILDEETAGHLQNEIEAAALDTFKRFYGMVNQSTQFMPNGNIVVTNAEGTLTVVKGEDEDGHKTITETLVTDGDAPVTYVKVTTFIPAGVGTNKTIREEYTTE